MNMFRFVLLSTVILVAACASAPKENSATTPPQTSRASDALEPVSVTADTQLLVLDENSLNTGSVVVCRQMLRQLSNVIDRQCMTRDNWKIYERALELQAQRILRNMRGGL
jgi:hypothetical protein